MELLGIQGKTAIFLFADGTEIKTDAEDVERIAQYRWTVDKTGEGKVYIRCRSAVFSAALQRFIVNAPADVGVQYANGDMLDFRKENLRIVTRAEIAQTRRRGRTSSTGVENVTVIRAKGQEYYFVSVTRGGVKKSKIFPLTPDGLDLAAQLAERWRNDISYEPLRTHIKRKQRDFSYEPPKYEMPTRFIRTAPDELPEGTWRIEGDDAYLTIRPGIEAIVSRKDMARVAQHRWYLAPSSRGSYYAKTAIDGRTVYMHRFIMEAALGTYVDHREHDTLDNRRSNLRFVSNEQNNAHRGGAYANSKTGIRGVSIHKMKPNGSMYAFRCSVKSCPTSKYFEYSEQGLAEAKVFAEAHYEAMRAALPV